MSLISRLALIATVAAASATHMAQAASTLQTETFTIASNSPPTGGFETKGGGSFNQFDSGLGTLTSVSVMFSGAGTLSAFGGGGTLQVVSDVDIGSGNVFSFVGLGQSFSISSGSEAIALSTAGTLPDTSANNDIALALFAGSGTVLVQPGFEGDDASIDDIVFSFPTLTETLTYTYDPAIAAVPEPASFALLGFGLVAVMIRVRSRARDRAVAPGKT